MLRPDVNKTAIQIPPECTLPIFHRWVTIFVAHFLAKRTLEYHTTQFFLSSPNNFSKPKFKILAVNGEEYKVPHWDEFKCVIREALTKVGEEETERIIEILERRIGGGRTWTGSVRSQMKPSAVCL